MCFCAVKPMERLKRLVEMKQTLGILNYISKSFNVNKCTEKSQQRWGHNAIGKILILHWV